MSIDPKATTAKLTQQVAVKGKDGTQKRYKIVYEREACIGAAACVAAYPERWEIVDDGKADLKDASRNDDNSVQELEVTEEEFQKMMDSAQACPVAVIHIIDLETDERVI